MFSYNIFLIGFMGSGKSTIAAHMGQKYGMKVVEMDVEIAEKEGLSIPDIFSQKGEAYFRERETQFLLELQMENNQIVSCGGGAVLKEQNVSCMKKNGKIILLCASPESILQRVKDDQERPLLKGKKTVEAIAELMEARREKYEKAADMVIHTDGKSVDEIVCELVNMLKEKKER